MQIKHNSHAKQQGWNDVETYADRRLSVGRGYVAVGGQLIGETSPGYFWVPQGALKRISRYSTQKQKLGKLLGDRYRPEETELQNMLRTKHCRIWDCGHLIFRFE
jgi:hypothetical protein